MERPQELLIIDPPNELRFCGPFNRPVITIMQLTNPTEHTILFKIKTTAPKRYCVRPNFGAVQPQSFTRVEICLQAFVYDANEKNKHKFMVQSLIAPENCTDYNKLWKIVEPDQLMDAKLKCVFEMPAVAPAAEISGTAPNEIVSKEVSPKPLGEEKSVDQADITAEVMHLRSVGSELRKENLNLKEQVMRLRCSSLKQTMNEPYSPMVEKQIPMFYIALSIAAAIFGILLGKYLL